MYILLVFGSKAEPRISYPRTRLREKEEKRGEKGKEEEEEEEREEESRIMGGYCLFFTNSALVLIRK